jgi:hypothetical protein
MLVHVLPDALRSESRIAVVYAKREFVPPAVRAFVDTVIAWGSAEFASRLPLLAHDPTKPKPRLEPKKRAAPR